MRVIAGEFRSRKLLSVEGVATRPTSDRLRETLFNIIGTAVRGAVFVDAYAGTGAVGIEALSRGAAEAVFIEKDRRALEAIRTNLAALGIETRARVIAGKASVHLGTVEADILFLDPPYTDEREYGVSLERIMASPPGLGVEQKITSPPGLVIVQHSVRFAPADDYGALHRYRVVRQGDNALSFYRPGESRVSRNS